MEGKNVKKDTNKNRKSETQLQGEHTLLRAKRKVYLSRSRIVEHEFGVFGEDCRMCQFKD